MNINTVALPSSLNNQISLSMIKPVMLALGLLLSLFLVNSASAEFKVQDVSAYEAIELLEQNPEIKILDVRTAAEFNSGHVKGAVLVPG